MRCFSFLLALLFVCCSISRAVAGPVTDRVKARGVVWCGGVERPGLAVTDGHGHWKGLEVDVCRAVADAVLGSPDRIEFHAYETGKDFDVVHSQKDDIFFLTGSEIVRQKLAGKVLPGPHRVRRIAECDGDCQIERTTRGGPFRGQYLLYDRESGRTVP